MGGKTRPKSHSGKRRAKGAGAAVPDPMGTPETAETVVVPETAETVVVRDTIVDPMGPPQKRLRRKTDMIAYRWRMLVRRGTVCGENIKFPQKELERRLEERCVV